MDAPTVTPTINSTPLTASESPAPTPNLKLPDTKLSLDNLNEWDQAFTEAKGEGVTTDDSPAKEAEATETVETIEDEDQVEQGAPEKKEAETDKTETEKPVTDKPQPQKRDYSKFDPADVPFLKHMSNAAFKHITDRIAGMQSTIAEKEAALAEVQGGKTLPDSWYNDPAAAEATPEFKSIKTEFDKTQAETGRLGNLLDAYEDGQVKYDQATGKFIPNDDETPPSKAIARQLSDARTQLFEKQKELANKGNTLVENFGKVYQTAAGAVDGDTEKLLPWAKDEKHAWHEPFKQLFSRVPKVFRGHPLAKQNAALAAAAIGYKVLYDEASAKLKGKSEVRTDQRRNGPAPSRAGNGANGEADKKYKLEDFS